MTNAKVTAAVMEMQEPAQEGRNPTCLKMKAFVTQSKDALKISVAPGEILSVRAALV